MLMQKIVNERRQLESSNACHDRVASGKGCRGARVQGCKGGGVAMLNEYKETHVNAEDSDKDDRWKAAMLAMTRLQGAKVARVQGCRGARVQGCKGARVQWCGRGDV